MDIEEKRRALELKKRQFEDTRSKEVAESEEAKMRALQEQEDINQKKAELEERR